jgi:hypothetical protein
VVGSYQAVAGLGAPADTAASTTVANTNTPASNAPAPSEAPSPRIADAASAVADVARVVDIAAQQRVIGDPQTALPDIFESVARAKGFGGVSDSAQLSFSAAIDLLRGLIADLAPSEANTEVEHGERREDNDDK